MLFSLTVLTEKKQKHPATEKHKEANDGDIYLFWPIGAPWMVVGSGGKKFNPQQEFKTHDRNHHPSILANAPTVWIRDEFIILGRSRNAEAKDQKQPTLVDMTFFRNVQCADQKERV